MYCVSDDLKSMFVVHLSKPATALEEQAYIHFGDFLDACKSFRLANCRLPNNVFKLLQMVILSVRWSRY